MKYFFSIAYNGVNKNGNSTYKVTGFRMGNFPNEFVTLGKDVMQEFVGGRWNDKTESVTTQKDVSQIVDKLKNHVENFAFGIVRG